MKKSKTFFACAMLVTLASCSNDHVLSQQNNTPSDPDVINIVAASSKAVTRAVIKDNDLQDTQFADDELINVYLEENTTGTATTTYSMLRYKVTSTTNDGGKQLELVTTDPAQTPPHYPISGNGIDAYALYPAVENSSNSEYDITSNTIYFSVAEDQKNIADYRKSDLMFGTNNWDTNNSGQTIANFAGTKKPNPVKLYFKHLLSKIIVKLKPGDGLTANQLKGATVKLYNAYPKANITVAKSGITVTVDNTSTIPTNGYILTDSYASTESSFDPDTYSGCAGIIIPQDITVPSSPTVTTFIEIQLASGYGSAKYIYNIADNDTNTSDNKMTFAPGNQYTYTLTLSAGKVVVVSTLIQNWNNTDISGDADLKDSSAS